jgi:Rieske Fe-S protein
MSDVHGEAEEQSEFCSRCVDRRSLLQGIAAIGVGLAAGPAFAQDPASMPPQIGDVLVPAYGGSTTPITVNDLTPAGGPIEAYAMDPASQVVRRGTVLNRLTIFRFDPAELSADAQARATSEGVIGYTIICTHAACEANEWLGDMQILQCPCHYSQFNPRTKASVVQGPAVRSLPSLGLRSENGTLIVAAPFDGRVGGDVDA